MENKKIEMVIKNVNKKYFLGKPNELHVLKDINLEIEKNKMTAIIGPSGSGKSTLLHLLGLLDKPTSGKIFLQGKDVSELSEDELARVRNREIGFVFQFFNLHPDLTALENVELPLMIRGVDEKIRKEKAKKLLELVEVGHRINHFPKQLSGGEQQRIAIARALINEPSLILADEPTGNLDSKTGKEIVEILKKLRTKSTIVMITHDKSIAKQADIIVTLKDGRIIQ